VTDVAWFEAATLVGLGGAVGAIFRSTVSRRLVTRAFPVGTLVVNALGTFLLSVLVFGGVSDRATLLVGVGFCGAFTTFSSFAYETVRLWEAGRRGRAILNGSGNLLAAAIAFLTAWVLSTVI
jgi:CrcB protein